jgi:23S rRNA pseudouridine1911/1915/1917 synthase
MDKKKSVHLHGKRKQSVFTVDEPAPLLEFLIARMPDRSRSSVKSLLAHHQVSVGYRVTAQFDHLVKPGQQVAVTWGKVQQGSPRKGLSILYEDASVIVVEKKAGLLSIATDREKERTVFRILSDQAKEAGPRNRVFVVHRLDREASGIMVFAKSRAIQEIMQRSWRKDLVERCYTVIVEGIVEKDSGTVISWLKENKARCMYSSSMPDDGLRAVTHYQVLKRSGGLTMLEVKLETGRKNQIRVHMKDLGHCIVGDRKYGTALDPIGRMGLHARVLAFRHPVTGDILRFETPVPGSFRRLFENPDSR